MKKTKNLVVESRWTGLSCILTADAVPSAADLGQRRHLVDTRTLERTYVDGDTIKMELVLTTARGDTVRITRYLVRSALPAPAPVAAAVAPPG